MVDHTVYTDLNFYISAATQVASPNPPLPRFDPMAMPIAWQILL